MKKYIFTTLLVLIGFQLFAQEEIKVKLKDKKFYDTEAIAYVVEIPQAEHKTVERAWAKYLKSNRKETVIQENGLFTINKKYLPKISTDSIDITSYIKDYNQHIVLSVAFKLNEKYISDLSDDEIHYPALEYVRNFAVEQYQNAVKKELNEEKKKYTQLENELKALQSTNDKYNDEIVQLKNKIASTEDLVRLNELDQQSKVLQIQAQKEVVYKLTNSPGDEKKDAEKILKEIERDFNKLQSKKKSLLNKVSNMQAQIRSKKRLITENEKEQKLLGLEKDDQEYIYRKVEKKLERIR